MSTQLPWDRFGPPPQAEPTPRPAVAPPESPSLPPQPPPPAFPEPEQPPVPPPQIPVPAAPDDLHARAQDFATEVLGYLKEGVDANMAGQQVDWSHPTVTATTAQGRELVVADAKNRSVRTLVQGLIFDLVAAFIAVIATLSGADPFQKQTWIAFGVLLFKSLISAAISYFMRLRITPTIKTPEGERVAIMPLMEPLPEKVV